MSPASQPTGQSPSSPQGRPPAKPVVVVGASAKPGASVGSIRAVDEAATDTASHDSPPRIDTFLGLNNADLVARYALGIERCDRRVMSLDDGQLDTAFLPEANVGRWPVRVLLGHLADAELVFVHRMRRAVAEDHPLLAVFDEQAFIDAGLYGSAPSPAPGGAAGPTAPPPPIGAFIATIHTLRKWTSEWLGSLSSRQWERGALHPERGPLTVRKIAEYDTWHLEHHVWYLNRKVARFLGEPEERTGG